MHSGCPTVCLWPHCPDSVVKRDKGGARRTEEAINAGISGLGRNLFLMELLDDRSAGDDPDHDW